MTEKHCAWLTLRYDVDKCVHTIQHTIWCANIVGLHGPSITHAQCLLVLMCCVAAADFIIPPVTHVCVCVCVCLRACTRAPACACACMCVRLHVRALACVCLHAHVRMRERARCFDIMRLVSTQLACGCDSHAGMSLAAAVAGNTGL